MRSPADTHARLAPEVGAGEEPQQKDNLCGPFHAARFLRDAGIAQWGGQPLDQDLVALKAGTALPARGPGPQVPPGAVNWREYRYDLGLVDPERSGTDASALAGAIEELSAGMLSCVPLRGPWTGEAVERLVEGATAAGARLLANVHTALLWGSRPPLPLLLAVLDGREVADPPAPDWDVGHFVELVQLVRGRSGALVLVRDSYPSLGWAGHHLQPPAALSAALIRGDGRGGGVLAAVSSGEEQGVRTLAAELGLEVALWQN